MTRPELRAEVGPRATAAATRGRDRSVVLADDDRAVVKLVVLRGHEQRDQQLATAAPRRAASHRRRTPRARASRSNTTIAPSLRARQLRARRDDLVDAASPRAGGRTASRSGRAGRARVECRLEHDDDEDDEVADEVVEQPRHGRQLEPLGDEERRADRARCRRPSARRACRESSAAGDRSGSRRARRRRWWSTT